MKIIMFKLKNQFMKRMILLMAVLMGIASAAYAVETTGVGQASRLTFTALLVTALITAVVHTLTGPDHYLPFIAIAKSRDYSLEKTLFWTFICGLGHIGSALLLALLFVYFSHWLTEAKFTWVEDHRADLAAYAMIGLGATYLVWAVWHRIRHKYGHGHHHELIAASENKNISIWVLFIIFVLGPCETLLPILTASSVLGATAVVATTLLFSISTIATMMIMVTAGMLGLKALHLQCLHQYAHEIAGGTIMACGLAIVFGL